MSGISPDTSSIESEYCSASLELATPITKLYKRREMSVREYQSQDQEDQQPKDCGELNGLRHQLRNMQLQERGNTKKLSPIIDSTLCSSLLRACLLSFVCMR